jgi:hypothetical protein
LLILAVTAQSQLHPSNSQFNGMGSLAELGSIKIFDIL